MTPIDVVKLTCAVMSVNFYVNSVYESAEAKKSEAVSNKVFRSKCGVTRMDRGRHSLWPQGCSYATFQLWFFSRVTSLLLTKHSLLIN